EMPTFASPRDPRRRPSAWILCRCTRLGTTWSCESGPPICLWLNHFWTFCSAPPYDESSKCWPDTTPHRQGHWLHRLASAALLAGLFAAMRLSAAEWEWSLPQGFPKPVVPADNPMSAAKIEFGRYLFYDKRMSVNGKQSCASCHRQELAFTDGRARAEGTTGQLHPRGSMSLVNVAYSPTLTWAHPTLVALEEQALLPMLGEDPIELGLKGHEPDFLQTVRHDAVYQRL